MRAFVVVRDGTAPRQRTVALDLRAAEALALAGNAPCDIRIRGERYAIVGKPAPGSFVARRKEA